MAPEGTMNPETQRLAQLPGIVGNGLRAAQRTLSRRSSELWTAVTSLPADKQRSMLTALLFGASVLCTLWSFRLDTLVMGDAALGVGLYAPDEGSPEMLGKLRLRWWSDALFYCAQLCALSAIVAQCWEPIRLVFGKGARPRRA